MIFIDFVVMCLFIGMLGTFGFIVFTAATGGRKRTLAETRAAKIDQTKAARMLARSVRLLERGLDDAIYRQSDDWETVAREIVDDYNEGD